ncbi:MAG: winged helix-turn-helix domain-containing protein [Promethearchaeota archaeon]
MEDETRKIWILVSYVKRSKNRQKLVKELAVKPNFPSELVKNLQISFSIVSKNLRSLQNKNIVICFTPNEKKGRLYSLSDIGRDIVNLLNEKG